jgi:plasmid stabilization system protein ParE
MNVRKTDDFVADVELQYQWYAEHARWEIAERYLSAISSACTLLERQPLLGPTAGLNHPRLKGWRFFVVLRPFNRHLLFYEVAGGDLVLRRAMHGYRNLPQRLVEPPGEA